MNVPLMCRIKKYTTQRKNIVCQMQHIVMDKMRHVLRGVGK